MPADPKPLSLPAYAAENPQETRISGIFYDTSGKPINAGPLVAALGGDPTSRKVAMKKLLIVDDSKAMRMIVRRALRQANIVEHSVEEASNGEEALQKLAAGEYDLILADWNMPQMNGIDLLKAVRAQGNSIQFGFVTSEGTGDIRTLAMDNGAQFLIVKPFTPEAIYEALKPLGLA